MSAHYLTYCISLPEFEWSSPVQRAYHTIQLMDLNLNLDLDLSLGIIVCLR